jgi:hypothetical protein
VKLLFELRRKIKIIERMEVPSAPYQVTALMIKDLWSAWKKER